jgi:hypothetical protein
MKKPGGGTVKFVKFTISNIAARAGDDGELARTGAEGSRERLRTGMPPLDQRKSYI